MATTNEYSNTLGILLCGPAGLGKTKAVEYLRNQGYDFNIRSCKDHLHTLTREFFCVSEERYWEIYNDRILKESPLKDFEVKLTDEENHLMYLKAGRYVAASADFSTYLSIREAMIYMSEVIIKPRMGSAYFGKARALSVQPNEVFLDDSTAAFDVDGEILCDEVYPLIEKIGQDNILLLRLHREGFDFTGDSRRYVPDGVCKNTVDIYNVDELEFYQEVEGVVNDFIQQRSL